jgi:hypothetical protein
MHTGLDLNRTASSIDYATEFDEEAVAHDLEDTAAMLHHGWFEEFVTMLSESAECSLLTGLHKTAVAHDVSRKNGS